MAAIFDLQHAQTYYSIYSSLLVLPDPGVPLEFRCYHVYDLSWT